MKQSFKQWLVEGSINTPFIIYNKPTIVYHTTSKSAADQITQHGFKTGHELNISEKRKAVYFSDKHVNPDLYARNKEGETYQGQEVAYIPLDIKGLKLLNMTYIENGQYINYKKYNNLVVRGELDSIPYDIDGTISFLEDGSIYEVALKPSIVNKKLQ